MPIDLQLLSPITCMSIDSELRVINSEILLPACTQSASAYVNLQKNTKPKVTLYWRNVVNCLHVVVTLHRWVVSANLYSSLPTLCWGLNWDAMMLVVARTRASIYRTLRSVFGLTLASISLIHLSHYLLCVSSSVLDPSRQLRPSLQNTLPESQNLLWLGILPGAVMVL